MNTNTISYYGKLPSHGDFISQQAPRAFTEVWDNWLQNIMLAGRKQFSEDWVANFMTMKSYRFILSSGVAGEVIWCGILFPSRDKSGRLFPFTVCVPLSAKETTPIDLFSSHHEWLEKLDQLTMNCFRPDFDTDKFRQYQQYLASLAEERPHHITQSNHYTCKDGSSASQQSTFAWHSARLQHAPTQEVINNALLNTLLNEYCHAHSIWWTKDNNDFMLCQGLPAIELTPALVDGQWAKWGWLCDDIQQNNTVKQANSIQHNNETEQENQTQQDDETKQFRRPL
jgi:type VI secretion system protein ImpM